MLDYVGVQTLTIVAATFPYMLLGSRFRFNTPVLRLLFGCFLLGQLGAMTIPVTFAMQTGEILRWCLAISNIIVISALIVGYMKFLDDRRRKNDCAILVDNILPKNEKAFSKKTGFVMPWKLDPILQATTMAYPPPEVFVDTLKNQGFSVITFDDNYYENEHRTQEIIHQLYADLDEKMAAWTAGAIHKPERSYHFMAFSNQNDATLVRLTYT